MLGFSLSLLEQGQLITLKIIGQPEYHVFSKAQLNFSQVNMRDAGDCIICALANEELRSTGEENRICTGCLDS